MNIKIKTYLIVIVTLLIGFFSGILTYRLIGKPETLPFAFQPGGHGKPHDFRMRKPEVLKKRMEMILQLSNKQKEQINPILNKYSNKFFKKMDEDRKKMMVIRDSLKKELLPFLRPEQKEKLNRVDSLRGMRRKGKW